MTTPEQDRCMEKVRKFVEDKREFFDDLDANEGKLGSHEADLRGHNFEKGILPEGWYACECGIAISDKIVSTFTGTELIL